METDILAVLRDTLVIVYMLVVRIGVPILITLMIGMWLRRLLEDKTEQPQPAEQAASSGRHCWETSKTQEAQAAQAIAQARPDLPCWLALQVGGTGLKEACYSCPLYTQHVPVAVRL
ncbi:MAG: hypothetical protein WCF84_24220 [Anaerolineae bacterium]